MCKSGKLYTFGSRSQKERIRVEKITLKYIIIIIYLYIGLVNNNHN